MRRAGIPAALCWVLFAVGLAGVTWALAVPPWQVPDEDAHFAYAQTIAELHRRPVDNGRPEESTEQRLAERASGFRGSYQRVEAKPQWSPPAEARWAREDAALGPEARRDGGGKNAARNNPPTFYVYSALAYEAAGGTIFDRLYAMRLWSVGLLLALTVSAWLLAGELTGRDRLAQLCAAALTGLLPMATFLSASVTVDAMLFPVWGFATWLGVRILRRGSTRANSIALVLVTLAAVLVKTVGVALIPGLIWALAVAFWRRRGLPRPGRRTIAAGIATTATAAVAVAIAIAPGTPGRLLSYLWQFYLPELPGQQRIALLPQWPLRDVWFEGVTGAFGWLEVRFPAWVYLLLAIAAALLAIAAFRALRGRIDAPLAAFLALPVLALLAGLHLTEYRLLVLDDEAFNQGRYLLPLAPLAAGCAGAGVAALRRRDVTAGLVLGGLVAWQLASLAIVTARFYA
jgi:4-amino-4-deoxy-L-arabinose transferase-like glycosyltransferase